MEYFLSFLGIVYLSYNLINWHICVWIFEELSDGYICLRSKYMVSKDIWQVQSSATKKRIILIPYRSLSVLVSYYLLSKYPVL
jgi:hypothetical protein